MRLRETAQAREQHQRALEIATELDDHGRIGWTHGALMARAIRCGHSNTPSETLRDGSSAALSRVAAMGTKIRCILALRVP